MVSGQEGVAVAKVLNAAAMTYVAAAASAIATLLYFLLRSGLLGSRDD
jgi:Zn-dependent membrane protease YugP